MKQTGVMDSCAHKIRLHITPPQLLLSILKLAISKHYSCCLNSFGFPLISYRLGNSQKFKMYN